MRVSNPMLYRAAMRGIQRDLAALSKAQDEASSGRRIRAVSDDPIGATLVMRLGAHLRDIDRFVRAGSLVETRLSAEDAVLGTVRDLVDQASAAAADGAVDAPDDPLRQNALGRAEAILEQLIGLGNTKVGNEYIFGGARSTTPPFLEDGSYAGDSTVRLIEIDEGVTIETNHTGDQVLTTVIDAVRALVDELGAGTADSIRQTVPGLEAAGETALSAQTAIGSRIAQVREVRERLGRFSIELQDRRDAIQNADPSESMLELLSRQQALERAYASISQVLSKSLLDYLQ